MRYERVIPRVFSWNDRDGFVDVYKQVFAEKPYEEHYTDEEVVEGAWNEHLEHGIIILAREDSGRVIGFGCAVPVDRAPDDVQEFIAGCVNKGLIPRDLEPKKTWYMSELGVLPDYRYKGVAYQLVRHRLISADHAGADYYVMRTSAVESKSRHLYEMIGSAVVPETHDVSKTDQVTKNGSVAVERVYLYGKCDTAMAAIHKQLVTKGVDIDDQDSVHLGS